MLDYKIQKISSLYLNEALKLVFSVFMEFEGNEYSEAGINEFRQYIDNENIAKLLKENLKMWIAVLNNKVIGVIATRDINHISLLFVAKEYHQQGIASNLFEKVLYDCAANNKNEISVNSSPYAKIIYNKFGFKETDKEQLVNGIKFIPMKLMLDKKNTN